MLPSNFQKIVNDVSRIDKETAKWLKDILLNLDNYCPMFIKDTEYYVDNVDNLLIWNETPQGVEFWRNIHNKVKKLSRMNRNGANNVA